MNLGIRWVEVSVKASFTVVPGLDFWKLEEVCSDVVQEGIVFVVFWVNGLNEMRVLSDNEISQC